MSVSITPLCSFVSHQHCTSVAVIQQTSLVSINQSIFFFFFVDTAQLIHTSDLLSKTLCNGFDQEVIIWVNENMLGLHSVTVYSEHIFGGKMQVSGIFFLT